MNLQRYEPLWERIKTKLDKKDSAWEQRIAKFGQVGAVEERMRGRTWNDDDVFKGLALSVLSNNTDWARVESVQSELNQVFFDFSLQKFAKCDSSQIERANSWFRERRAGSAFLRQSLIRLRRAAQLLMSISNRTGSVDQYLRGARM